MLTLCCGIATPIPASTTRAHKLGWSAKYGTHTIGLRNRMASCTLLAPPCVTKTLTDGCASSAGWLTQSTMSKLRGTFVEPPTRPPHQSHHHIRSCDHKHESKDNNNNDDAIVVSDMRCAIVRTNDLHKGVFLIVRESPDERVPREYVDGRHEFAHHIVWHYDASATGNHDDVLALLEELRHGARQAPVGIGRRYRSHLRASGE